MKQNQKGFAALYLSLLVVFVLSGLGASVFFTISAEQRMVENARESLQAYYGAESGIEDALLRIKESLIWSNPGTLGVVGAGVTTTITDTAEGKLVVAEGNDSERIRKVEALFRLSGTTPQFFYGAHVGQGGLEMDNNSRVVGNVYSNGDVDGSSGAIITDTVTVAGQSELEDVRVQGDAYVDECEDAEIEGTLYTNDNDDCEFGAIETLGIVPDIIPLPVTGEEILQWKAQAAAGGVSGSVALDGSDTLSLGPVKIQGNLEVDDSASLTVLGTIWVTGSIDIENNAQVRLDSSFGSASGVVIADGTIDLENNSISSGSGTQGSYLMYLTTRPGSDSLEIENNAIADIVYASAGEVSVENNAQLKEVTGYKVHAKNNAVITFETGLQSSTFTSGPGAGWELVSWKEVE